MSFGEDRITSDVTTDKIKSDEPRSTEMPITMPSVSPPSEAEIEANTSGAPAPKAMSVTPAKLSDILNVLDIFSKAGPKYSSAVKLKTKNASSRRVNYYSS